MRLLRDAWPHAIRDAVRYVPMHILLQYKGCPDTNYRPRLRITPLESHVPSTTSADGPQLQAKVAFVSEVDRGCTFVKYTIERGMNDLLTRGFF